MHTALIRRRRGGSALALYAVNGSMPDTVYTPTFQASGGVPTTGLVTHSRSGTATYLDSTGTLQTAADGVLRDEAYAYVGGELTGPYVLREPAATNLVTYSQDFDNAAWTKDNATVTANYAAAPDGTMTADRLEISGVSNNCYTTFAQTAPGATLTLGVWTKGAAAELSEIFLYNEGGAVRTEFALTGDWQFSSVSHTRSSSDTVRVASVFDGREISSNPASDVLIWGAQLEANPVPTSYIPTSGSTATRNADTLTIPTPSAAAMSGSMSRLISYADTGTATEATLLDHRVDANNRITITLDTAGANTGKVTLTVVNGGSSVSVTSTNQITPGVNRALKVAWRVTASDINIALNGTAASAVSNTAGVPDLSSADETVGGIVMLEMERRWIVGLDDSAIAAAST